jgi:hypothetical protein
MSVCTKDLIRIDQALTMSSGGRWRSSVVWSATTAAPDRGRLFVRWEPTETGRLRIVTMNPLTNRYVPAEGIMSAVTNGTVGSSMSRAVGCYLSLW